MSTRSYVDSIYIPSGLLVVGCLIVKREWVPYAVVVAALLSGYKLLSGSSEFCPQAISPDIIRPILTMPSESQKVLKPTEFQSFELTEKTIISHNVAM